MQSVGVYLAIYLKTRCRAAVLGFIDSTPLVVCLNPQIHCHKVFAGLAERGKSSTGWFFGFKLHLVANEKGEILNIKLTPGNVDDRKPVPDLLKDFFGSVYGDKGYISKIKHSRHRSMNNFIINVLAG